MKRIVLIVFLVAMVGIGWFSWAKDLVKESNELEQVNQMLKDADSYVEDGLYQRAISNYGTVLEYYNTEENWTKLINAYQKRYEEDPGILSAYINSLESAIKECPKNRDFVVRLMNFYLDKRKYQDAYNLLVTAEKSGVTDEELANKKLSIRYIYSEKTLNFDSFIGIVNGSYMIFQNEKWGSIFADGSKDYSLKYEYLSPMSGNGTIIITNEKDSRLTENNGVVLGIFPFKVHEAGILSQGLIPVKNGDKYAYYDTFAKKQEIGEFEKATTFVGSNAAVKKDGKWYLCNTKGELVSDAFEDIVMSADEKCFSNGVMIAAKEPNKYSLYDENIKQIGDFVCEDMDISSNNSLIAFKQGGKWGFVNTSGKVVIEPQYENAKSFSYGLAAVSKNGKWGFINTENKLVIEYQYKDADYFNSESCCIVQKESLDREQNVILEYELLELELGV